MTRRLLTILLLFTVCETLGGALEHNSLAQTGVVKIVPTSYLEMVAERLSQPGVTFQEMNRCDI